MSTLIVCLASALAAGLTLFSGFGLGTLLMPVLCLFFPVPLAVALTAVVHLLNNLFKGILLGRCAEKQILLRFGIPAVLAAWIGARGLVFLSKLPPLATYSLFETDLSVRPVNCILAVLMVGFALLELLPRLKNLSFGPRYLPFGGILSGFFGGLSGHQGAFRSAFLTKCGLSKESFLGTGIVIAIGVDLARVSVYAGHFRSLGVGEQLPLLAAATLSAFLGVWVSSRFIQKTTMAGIQKLVAILLLWIAAGLASGLF